MNSDTNQLTPTNKTDTSLQSRSFLESKGKKNQYRREIFSFIQKHNNATCDEVEVGLNMRHQTASCYIRFLTQDGFLIDSGERRLTRTGRAAIVWKPSDFNPNLETYKIKVYHVIGVQEVTVNAKNKSEAKTKALRNIYADTFTPVTVNYLAILQG